MKQVLAIHHFASSGGTVILRQLLSKALFVPINEWNPFEFQAQAFQPSDLYSLASQSLEIGERQIELNFRRQFRYIKKLARRKGPILFRTHTHFDYFPYIRSRPAREVLRDIVDKEIITVRDPLDNFVSAVLRGFVPNDFGEYLKRYHHFLGSTLGLPLFTLEDLVSAPDSVTLKMIGALGLKARVDELPHHLLPAFSGDQRNPQGLVQNYSAKPQHIEFRDAVESEICTSDRTLLEDCRSIIETRRTAG